MHSSLRVKDSPRPYRPLGGAYAATLAMYAIKPVCTGVVSLMLVGWLFSVNAHAVEPQLIPQPREIKTTGEAFQVTPDLQIELISPGPREDVLAAASLHRELNRVTGHQYAITSAVVPDQHSSIVLGRFDQPEMAKLLEADGISTEGIGEQGYVLQVTPAQVLVAGKDAAGLFYGVQTLRQLVVGDAEHAEILGVSIRDWPALLFRGTQVDLARGPVPKLSYLKRIVRTISAFKLNQLYLYMEDSFRLRGQPLIGVLSDTLSQDDWKTLVAYAAKYHVGIVPATEDCGHLHKVLRFDEYSPLGERPHGHGLAADDPQAMDFLNKMYQQLVPIFPSKLYHIGCDETFDLGLGRSAQLVAKEGYGQVYVDNLIKVANLVHRYNKQVMFWGDIAVEHPEMIPSLPKNLVVASWEYGSHPSYEKWIKPFEGTGMKIFVCPWAGATGVIMGDYAEAAVNIEGFLTDGKKEGAIGTDITVWNDDGESLYGMNWWSIVYGAAVAWEPGRTPVDEFNQKYDWAFYRNTDHRFADAIEQLSQLNATLRAAGLGKLYGMDYGGTADALFWHNPFGPQGQQEVKLVLPLAAQMRLTAEHAYTVLVDSASLARRNADTLPNLEFAALKLDALGMRYEYAQEIAQLYDEARANEQNKSKQDLVGNDLGEIDSTNGRLQDLRDYNTRLRELYKHLWLSENLPHWLPNILELYDRNAAMWQDQIAKYNRIKMQYDAGTPLPPPESLGLMAQEPPK
jgi:hexosaminidase